MKNVIVTNARPVMRIPMQGAPPLQGWSIRCLQDLPEAEVKTGYWMSSWSSDKDGVNFKFEEGLYMAFKDEAQANQIRDFLQANAEIETEVVKIGNPPVQVVDGGTF